MCQGGRQRRPIVRVPQRRLHLPPRAGTEHVAGADSAAAAQRLGVKPALQAPTQQELLVVVVLGPPGTGACTLIVGVGLFVSNRCLSWVQRPVMQGRCGDSTHVPPAFLLSLPPPISLARAGTDPSEQPPTHVACPVCGCCCSRCCAGCSACCCCGRPVFSSR